MEDACPEEVVLGTVLQQCVLQGLLTLALEDSDGLMELAVLCRVLRHLQLALREAGLPVVVQLEHLRGALVVQLGFLVLEVLRLVKVRRNCQQELASLAEPAAGAVDRDCLLELLHRLDRRNLLHDISGLLVEVGLIRRGPGFARAERALAEAVCRLLPFLGQLELVGSLLVQFGGLVIVRPPCDEAQEAALELLLRLAHQVSPSGRHRALPRAALRGC
mmetsp:Transcript_100666/g.259934  ORF Transcript_100666/g.259934 Transcript_100666/m.259934 type:complete len:219 (+) Transcript_100666:431-1087(+)